MNNRVTEYTTIRLPEDIVTPVDKLVGKYGFKSRAEVVKDALRDLFMKYPETKNSTVSSGDETK